MHKVNNSKIWQSFVDENLQIAVVGHERKTLEMVPKHKVLTPILLQDLSFDREMLSHNKFAESRLFFSNFEFDKSKKIVGCLTASWDEKFRGNTLHDIYHWKQIKNNFHNMIKHKNIVLCGGLCYGNAHKEPTPLWRINFQKHFRKVFPKSEFIEIGIYKITGMKYSGTNPAPYANQLICHSDLYNEYKNYINKIIGNLIDYFDDLNYVFRADTDRTFAYILEEISMLWWSNKQKISFVECGIVKQSWYANKKRFL